MPALYFEQLEDGQVFEHRWTRTVTGTDSLITPAHVGATCRRSALMLGRA